MYVRSVAATGLPEPPTSKCKVTVRLGPDLAPAAAMRVMYSQCEPYVVMCCEYRVCVV